MKVKIPISQSDEDDVVPCVPTLHPALAPSSLRGCQGLPAPPDHAVLEGRDGFHLAPAIPRFYGEDQTHVFIQKRMISDGVGKRKGIYCNIRKYRRGDGQSRGTAESGRRTPVLTKGRGLTFAQTEAKFRQSAVPDK